MKTNLKRLLSVILCIAMLCSTAALCASAEDAASAVEITAEPTIAVKRAEGETVYELEFRFAPDDAGTALPFTSFDPEKTITIKITEGGVQNEGDRQVVVVLTKITAKPTAFDPQTGVLTASVYDFKGNAGMNLHRLDMKYDSSALQDENLAAVLGVEMAALEDTIQNAEADIDYITESLLGYHYLVQLPADLLTGEGVGNAEFSFITNRIEGQVVREETIQLPKSFTTFLKVFGRLMTKEWFGQKLFTKAVMRFFEKMLSNGWKSLIPSMLMLLPIIGPIMLPAWNQVVRAWRSSLMSLAGIRFGGIITAINVLGKAS